MKSDEKLWSIVLNIYKEAYKKAEPSADLDKLIKEGKTKKEGWFMDYYLPDTEYKKIVEKHFKRNRISKFERGKMMIDIYLGAGPSGVKKSDRV